MGMKRALDSAIGLPSRSTSASWMLRFLIPDDVRRAFRFLPPSFHPGAVAASIAAATRRVRSISERSSDAVGANSYAW